MSKWHYTVAYVYWNMYVIWGNTIIQQCVLNFLYNLSSSTDVIQCVKQSAIYYQYVKCTRFGGQISEALWSYNQRLFWCIHFDIIEHILPTTAGLSQWDPSQHSYFTKFSWCPRAHMTETRVLHSDLSAACFVAWPQRNSCLNSFSNSLLQLFGLSKFFPTVSINRTTL